MQGQHAAQCLLVSVMGDSVLVAGMEGGWHPFYSQAYLLLPICASSSFPLISRAEGVERPQALCTSFSPLCCFPNTAVSLLSQTQTGCPGLHSKGFVQDPSSPSSHNVHFEHFPGWFSITTRLSPPYPPHSQLRLLLYLC